jgi:hypothetical protein
VVDESDDEEGTVSGVLCDEGLRGRWSLCWRVNKRLKLRALAQMHYGLYTNSTYDIMLSKCPAE